MANEEAITTKWLQLTSVKFRFAQHCYQRYSNVHKTLNNTYSEPIPSLEDLFIDEVRSKLVPNVVEVLKNKIVEAMAFVANNHTDDITLIKTLITPCAIYTILADDDDRQPIRNNDHFELILNDAIISNKNKVIVYININALHFKDGFMPEQFEDISATSFPQSGTTLAAPSQDRNSITMFPF